MTNEELEQKVKRLEEQLTEVRIELLERKASFIPYKPYEVEVPEDIENYYYVDEIGSVNLLSDSFVESDYDELYKRGLAFKTKEEAEQFDKERMLINKLKDWAKKYNGVWKPDWGDFSKYNHAVTYDYCEKFYVKSYSCVNFLSKLPYFKSEEIAEQFIKEFGEEIKEVLC
jgi:hypothetical protein|nr:MAG TPA: hypothetical protein [Caudoviricetes sp.]DAS08631.1 MAG TPA: hypothetical protein [Caudoviricetes sp.]